MVKFKHADSISTLNSLKVSANSLNTKYLLEGALYDGTPEVLWEDVVYIDDVGLVWTHGTYYGEGKVQSVNEVTPDESGNITLDSAYIKNYETRAEYDADTTRQIPTVSYIDETDELIYDKV